MRVKIKRVRSEALVSAFIRKRQYGLPSLADGWRFNFIRHSKVMHSFTYVLVTEEFPEMTEGCLIYKMKGGIEPYMAYIEVAPYNKGAGKEYDLVAGCLIAFACRLSFVHGDGPYKGWLAFDVQEESEEDEWKLMSLYSTKYHAQRLGNTTMMLIAPEDGERLITQYLETGSRTAEYPGEF
jgi:hypothetical protein